MRITKDEFLAKVRLEFEALDQLIARLEPGDWARPVPRPESRDPWTVKDAVAHILHWKALTIRRIKGRTAGGRASVGDYRDQPSGLRALA